MADYQLKDMYNRDFYNRLSDAFIEHFPSFKKAVSAGLYIKSNKRCLEVNFKSHDYLLVSKDKESKQADTNRLVKSELDKRDLSYAGLCGELSKEEMKTLTEMNISFCKLSEIRYEKKEEVFTEDELTIIRNVRDEAYTDHERTAEKLLSKESEPLGKMAHPNSELKKILESYWANNCSFDEVQKVASNLNAITNNLLTGKGTI